MPTPLAPPAVRAAQAVFLSFTAVVVVRGLASIAAVLPGSDRPGYVVGYYGGGPVLALAVAGTAALLIGRPGTLRFVFALVAASGVCLAGLTHVADTPPLRLLYVALGAAALASVIAAAAFLLGRGGRAASPSGPCPDPQPDPGRPRSRGPGFRLYPQRRQPPPAPGPQPPSYGGSAGR